MDPLILKERGGPQAAPLQLSVKRSLLLGRLLLALLDRRRALAGAIAERRGLRVDPLLLLAAGHHVERLLTRLLLGDRRLEMRDRRTRRRNRDGQRVRLGVEDTRQRRAER